MAPLPDGQTVTGTHRIAMFGLVVNLRFMMLGHRVVASHQHRMIFGNPGEYRRHQGLAQWPELPRAATEYTLLTAVMSLG